MGITLIRPGGVGDAFLAVPLLQILKRQHFKVAMFGHQFAVEILKDAGLVDISHRQGRGDPRTYESAIEIVGRLSSGQPEVEWQRKMQSLLEYPDLLLMWSTDVLSASYALEMMRISRFVVEDRLPPVETHQAEYMVNTLRNGGMLGRWRYGDSIESLELPYEIPPNTMPSAFDKSKTVFIHPSASEEWKRPPIELFQSLANKLFRMGQLSIVFEGPEEKRNLKQLFPHSIVIRDLTLKELAAVLSLKLPFISPDNGISHMAAAVGCPTVTLFGPTDPTNWAPVGQNVKVIRECDNPIQSSIRCCYDSDCMSNITVDQILEELN